MADLLDLLLGGVAERVAAEGDDDAIGLAERLRHDGFLSHRGTLLLVPLTTNA